ncbi:MAG: SDR family oxidoreductase [Clostridia bacterium]
MENIFLAGGSRGIGADTVRLFRFRGHQVVFSYNSSEKEARCLEIETGAFAVKANSADIGEVKSAFDYSKSILGFIDTLIINAGVSSFSQINDVSESDFYKLVNVNLLGAINYIKSFSPNMIEKKRGQIILVSSVQGITGASCESVYAMTKGGLIALSKSIALELAPSNIRVNCVAPGLIATDMNSRLSKSELIDLEKNIPLEKIGKGKDVAKAIYFLGSDEAEYITGQVLTVDGGWTIA